MLTKPFVALACVALVVATVGAPKLDALDRAVSGLFVADEPVPQGAPAQSSTDTTSGTAATRLFVSSDVPTGGAVEAAEPSTTPKTPVFFEHVAAPIAPEPPGKLMSALYVSFLSLQVLDIHSTLLARDRGAREQNAVLEPFVTHEPVFVAVKLGAAAGILYMAERVRRHNRVAAIVMIAAFNSAYATVVARNYRIAGQLDR
jgi:Domain of unknown function (DUF5658)